MKPLARAALAGLASLSLWAVGVGCTPTLIDEAFLMQNPLQAGGAVPQNRQVSHDRLDERTYGLPPGTLTSEGSMISMDAREVCFQVVLRTVGQRADLANPQSWRVFLRGLPEFEDMNPVFKAVTPPQAAEMQGMVTQHATEQQRICDNYGNCVNRSIQRSYTTPAMVTVIAGGGTVCFAGQGRINPGTRELALYLDDPHTVWPAQRRVAFGWRFPLAAQQGGRC